MIKKYWKVLLIAAGVMASAAFYVVSPEGDAVFSESGEGRLLLLPEKETEEPGMILSGEDAAFGAVNAGIEVSDDAGFTEKEKEELREIIGECLEESVKNAVNASLREELTAMMEDGRLSEALGNYAKVQSDLVNINTADEKELKTLSGIGDAKAAAICSYREEYGAFTSVEDLINVDGISEKLLDKIRDMITV